MFQRKQQKKLGIMEESLLFGSWNSETEKIEQMSLSLLKKRIVVDLLFGLLSVLSERIVANFRDHVTYCFSLLEGLLYTQSLKYCASTMHFLSAYYFVMIFSLLVIQQKLFEFIAY